MIRKLLLALCFFYCQSSMALHGEILPLFWYVKYTGDVQVSFKKVHFDSTKPGGMLYAQLQADRFGVFTNLMYAYSHEDKMYSGYHTHLVNKFGVVTVAAFYELWRQDGNFFAPYLGARTTFKNSKLRAWNSYLMIAGCHNKSWTDPLIGIRDTYYINRELYLFFSGDIGGLAAQSQYSYNLLGLIGYKLNDMASNLTFYAGYQWLHEQYRTKRDDDYFKWNMSFYGPLIGLSLSF